MLNLKLIFLKNFIKLSLLTGVISFLFFYNSTARVDLSLGFFDTLVIYSSGTLSIILLLGIIGWFFVSKNGFVKQFIGRSFLAVLLSFVLVFASEFIFFYILDFFVYSLPYPQSQVVELIVLILLLLVLFLGLGLFYGMLTTPVFKKYFLKFKKKTWLLACIFSFIIPVIFLVLSINAPNHSPSLWVGIVGGIVAFILSRGFYKVVKYNNLAISTYKIILTVLVGGVLAGVLFRSADTFSGFGLFFELFSAPIIWIAFISMLLIWSLTEDSMEKILQEVENKKPEKPEKGKRF